MRRLVVLGGGTAGTMIVNKLRRKLDRAGWEITVVDRDDDHLYQPGYLFMPFGTYTPDQVVRKRHAFIPDGVDLVLGEIDRVDAEAHAVTLEDGRSLRYDYLVIATGTSPPCRHRGPPVASSIPLLRRCCPGNDGRRAWCGSTVSKVPITPGGICGGLWVFWRGRLWVPVARIRSRAMPDPCRTARPDVTVHTPTWAPA